MKFKIVGTSREMGNELTITLEAASADEAESEAAHRGIVVSEVIPLADPLEEAMEEELDARDRPVDRFTEVIQAVRTPRIAQVTLVDVSAGAAFKFGFYAAIGIFVFSLLLSLIYAILYLIGHR